MNDLESLYRQHASAVFRFAWGLCGDRSAAEDIVSETFVRLLTRAPRIETQTALAYVLAIARNTYLNGRRHGRREVPLSEDIPDLEPDPGVRLHDRAQLDTVIEALRSMPEGERTALLLRVDHDMPYEEIAAILGTSLSAAKVRVHRARLRLASARKADERKP
jgi:RNA polymerase sigma-70 factor, ECF subfamily